MKLKKINKKAQGHVEMIISFVIFLGFLIFLFILFKPFKTPADSNLVDSVFSNLEKKLGVEIRTISISLRAITNPPNRCIEINEEGDKLTLSSDLNCNSLNMIVKDNEGNIIDSKLNYPIKKFLFDIKDKTFFTIYCGDGIELAQPDDITGCQEFKREQGDYVLGRIVDKRPWSEEKLVSFNSTYHSDYLNLKSEVVSGNTDFGLIIYNLDDEVIFNIIGKIPKNLEVNAKIFPIEIINKTASITRAKATLFVW